MRILFISLFCISFFISCKKEIPSKDNEFIFVFKRPSGYLSSDGSISLFSDNKNKINNIIWTNRSLYGFSSTEIDLHNISAGNYVYKITDRRGRNYTDSVFVASCDTIRPMDYFPSFPGSWWIYSNNDTIRCSDDYQKVPVYSLSVPTSADYDNPADSLYVVKADGVSVFAYSSGLVPPVKVKNIGIRGYDFLLPFKLFELTSEKFFCEESNCSFQVRGYHADAYGWTECTKIKTDTTVTANGKTYSNVQVVEKVCVPVLGYTYVGIFYFAQNIGLIKCEKKVDGKYVLDYELKDYFIKRNT